MSFNKNNPNPMGKIMGYLKQLSTEMKCENVSHRYDSPNSLEDMAISDIIKSYLNENGITITNSKCKEALRNRILEMFVHTKVFNSTSFIEHSKRQPPILNYRLNLIKVIIETYIDVRMEYLTRVNACGCHKFSPGTL